MSSSSTASILSSLSVSNANRSGGAASSRLCFFKVSFIRCNESYDARGRVSRFESSSLVSTVRLPTDLEGTTSSLERTVRLPANLRRSLFFLFNLIAPRNLLSRRNEVCIFASPPRLFTGTALTNNGFSGIKAFFVLSVGRDL